MSMEVTSIYSGYATGTYDSAIKKNTTAKNDKSNDANEYYESLCKRFSQISINSNGGILSSNKNKKQGKIQTNRHLPNLREK